MLVVTRYTGEAVKVGDDVTFTVLSVTGKTVRIGIVAPREVAVHREEIYDRINGQQHEVEDHDRKVPVVQVSKRQVVQRDIRLEICQKSAVNGNRPRLSLRNKDVADK